MRYITLDGKRYAWRDLLKLRREQKKAARQAQPALFELKEDARPQSQRTASSRYEEPTLFD
jgi:phage-related minor tail protein